METLREWGAIAATSFNEFISTLMAFLPRLLGAVVLLLLGWILARILRGLTLRLIAVIDRLLQRFAMTASPEYKRLRQSSSVLLSSFIFWLVILIFIAGATSVLKLQIFTRWFDSLLVYLPSLLAGAVIILAGIIFGTAARTLVTQMARSVQLSHSELLGRLGQFSVVATAIVIGINQLGVNVSFLTDLATVAFAVILAAFGLGVALATPGHVSNMISARQLQRIYQEGDEIAIGEYQGRIITISNNSVILDTEQGETIIPAKLFAEMPATKLPQR